MINTAQMAASCAVTSMVVAEALPLQTWEKFAIDAPQVAIIGWLLIKTIPQISRDHKEAVNDLADKLEKSHERTNSLLAEALNARSSTESDRQ